MKLTLTSHEARLYNKLSASVNDLRLADFCLKQIVKNGWHHGPFGGRGTTQEKQATYTCALVVSYGRVFVQSKGMGSLPAKVVKFNGVERECHRAIMDLRHKVFAHIDGSQFSTEPLLESQFLLPGNDELGTMELINWPALRITADQAAMLGSMIVNLQVAIEAKMEEIRRPYMKQLRSALPTKARA
jgi:hypothetical protein